MSNPNPLNIETVVRVNASPHRLKFTLHYDQIPVEFDVEPWGQVDVPKVWADPRPSTARLPAPSVLEMIAPHLVDPEDPKKNGPWLAHHAGQQRSAAAAQRESDAGGADGKGGDGEPKGDSKPATDPKSKSARGAGGIPG